jgi:hypothetical protein
MWKNILERGRPRMTVWRMHFACWIPKATNAHTGCVILFAFPLQQWLHERVSMLRYTYVACLVISEFSKVRPKKNHNITIRQRKTIIPSEIPFERTDILYRLPNIQEGEIYIQNVPEQGAGNNRSKRMWQDDGHNWTTKSIQILIFTKTLLQS